MQALPGRLDRLLTLSAACIGAVAIGTLDVVTGADVHVTSLYFLPLVLAGWRLPRAGAVFVALLCTGLWLGALYENGASYASPWIWVVNFLTQGAAFLTVAILVARLSLKLTDEQTLRRTDHLTGVMSRTGFVERANLALQLCRRHARPVSLVYIDLDNFKNANDQLGHAYGDDLLRRCGEILVRCIRATDVAGRIGGDEFVVLLPETGHEHALEVSQRILHSLTSADEFRIADVTASIGVVVDVEAQLDIVELLKSADAEMYRVKQGGRNAIAARELQRRPAPEPKREPAGSGPTP